MGKPKFELIKRSSGYYFNLKAGNGEIILSSEAYAAKQGAENGIRSVRENAPNENRYDKRDTPTYSFNLKAGNGEVIGRSETYSSAAARDNGIRSVRENAPGAELEEVK